MSKQLSAFVLSLAILFLGGCYSDTFYRHVIGNTTLIGIAVPQASNVSIDALSIVDGQKLNVKDPCVIATSFTKNITNSYFYVVNSLEQITSDTVIIPSNCLTEVIKNIETIKNLKIK